MTILEIAQGHGFGLTGLTLDRARDVLRNGDEAFLRKYPHCRQWFAPRWRVFETDETKTAPWGYEWYATDRRGVLKIHSAQYDSSG